MSELIDEVLEPRKKAEERKNNAETIINKRDAEIKDNIDRTVQENIKSSDDPDLYKYYVDKVYKDYMNNTKDRTTLWAYRLCSIDDYEKYCENITKEYDNFEDILSSLREKEEKDLATGFPKLPVKLEPKDAIKMVNPGRQSGVTELSGGGNCIMCTLATDLRVRGYDVSAPSADDYNTDGTRWYGPPIYGTDDLYHYESPEESIYSNIYEGKIETIGGQSKEKVIEEISKQKNTSGFFTVHWNNCDYGHAMYYQVDNEGKITIYDGQVATVSTVEEIMDISNTYEFTRTDHLKIKSENIKDKGWTVWY